MPNVMGALLSLQRSLGNMITSHVAVAQLQRSQRQYKHNEREPFLVGHRGHRIRLLQEALNNVMPRRITVDGLYGPQTQRAIRAFQGKYGLAVTGEADQDTIHRVITARQAQQSTSPTA